MSAAAPRPTFPAAAGFAARGDLYAFSAQTLASELPDFEIVREVGKGSMGIVFEARRRSDAERVALKVLPPSLTLTERALARFVREAELLGRVRHPAIVRALDHGRQGRLHYFAMEFVAGVTLEERLGVGPLPVRQAVDIAIQVARALHYAHDHGLLHRDIKPGNLMLREDGRVAITDFGLAREAGAGSMTESGSIVGTPKYMAPEQVLGVRSAIDTRSDVWGLGATLYELLTGVPPFDAPTAQGVLKAVLERDPIPPRRLRADLPSSLETIVLGALEKDPAKRYASAAEIADDLERCQRGEPLSRRRPSWVQRLQRAAVRHPLAALLLAVAVLAAAAGAVLWRKHQRDRLIGRVQQAETQFWLASGLRDDRLGPLSDQARRGHLEAAVDTTSQVLEEDPTLAMAWMVRAQARHRLQRYAEALADFDAAERCHGGPTLAILHFRIDTLRHLEGAPVHRRILADLATLLQADPGPATKSLVAAALVDLAEQAPPADRTSILVRAEATLASIRQPDARAAVTRVRALELRGDLAAAERAMAAARQAFYGDPVVHRHAAALYRRLGKTAQSEGEASLAQLLDPLAFAADADDAAGAEPPPPQGGDQPPVDMGEVRDFLQQLDSLLQAVQSR